MPLLAVVPNCRKLDCPWRGLRLALLLVSRHFPAVELAFAGILVQRTAMGSEEQLAAPEFKAARCVREQRRRFRNVRAGRPPWRGLRTRRRPGRACPFAAR